MSGEHIINVYPVFFMSFKVVIIISSEKRWYPYEALGPMYVHTNYNSFMNNVGGFGDHSGMFESELEAALNRQENREEMLSELLYNTFGIDLDDLVAYIMDWHEIYQETANEAWFSDEIKGREKYGKVLGVLHTSEQIQEAAKQIESVNESMADVMSKISEDGTINLEGFDVLHQEIEQKIDNLISTYGEYIPTEVDGKMLKGIQGSIYGVKGLVWEYFIGAVVSNFFREISDGSQEFTVMSTGFAEGAKADVVVPLEDQHLTISIKSTSLENFQKHGAYIHDGTIKSILKNIESFSPGAAGAVQDAKYYLINVSRMLAHPMTAQGGAKGGLGADPGKGQQMIAGLMKTYATVFLGESYFPDEGGLEEAVKHADLFILQDHIYKKSTVVRGLYQGKDFSALLRIDYAHRSSSYWEAFDHLKRGTLRASRGNYRDSNLLSFVRPEAERLLGQRASVKLRLLMK